MLAASLFREQGLRRDTERMLKRIAGACIDRRHRLLDSFSATESSTSSSFKPVADGGDRVVGGASTVQEQEASIDRMESQQVRHDRDQAAGLLLFSRRAPAARASSSFTSPPPLLTTDAMAPSSPIHPALSLPHPTPPLARENKPTTATGEASGVAAELTHQRQITVRHQGADEGTHAGH